MYTGVSGLGKFRFATRPSTNARGAFVEWMKRSAPAAYLLVRQQRPDLLSGLGDDDEEPTPTPGWADSIMKVVSAALPVYQQQQVMKMQLQRASQGLPPLPAKSIAPPGVPVSVGIDDKLLLLGGGLLGLVGLGIFLKSKRHGR